MSRKEMYCRGYKAVGVVATASRLKAEEAETTKRIKEI